VKPVSDLGAPIPLLVRESFGAELMVLGARGFGTAAQEVLGPVVEGVAGRADCPVVVIDGGEPSDRVCR
jgi:nucleotide-binding universal stress UspA family protein